MIFDYESIEEISSQSNKKLEKRTLPALQILLSLIIAHVKLVFILHTSIQFIYTPFPHYSYSSSRDSPES